MSDRPGQARRGFTLAEALLASVLLAASIFAVTVPFASAARNQQIEARRAMACGLAEALMEEILAHRFSDETEDYAFHVGPDPGESSRALFDNIDDYDGYGEKPGGIVNVAGEVIDDPAAFGLSRHVTAKYVYVTGQDKSQQPSFIRITVEVRYDGQPVVSLTRLVYDYGTTKHREEPSDVPNESSVHHR